MQQLHYLTILGSGVNIVLLGRVLLRYGRFLPQRIPGLVACLGQVVAALLYSGASTLGLLLGDGPGLYACGILMNIATLMMNTFFFIVVFTLTVDGRTRGLHRKIIFGIFVVLALLIATDGLHHLFIGGVTKGADGFLYQVGTGPLSAPLTLYALGLAVAAVVRVVRSGSTGVIRSLPVRVLLIFATVIPSVLGLLEGVVPLLGQLRVSLFFNWIPVTIIMYLFFGYLFTARQMAIRVMGDAYVVFNLQGNCVDINPQAEQFFEVYRATRRPHHSHLETLLETEEGAGEYTDRELRLPDPDPGEGEEEKFKHFLVSTFRLSDGINQDCGRGYLIREVTEYHRRMSQLNSLATEDPLTGAKNRRYLTQTADEVLAAAAADGVPLTVMMLDIDFFKRVNDVYGHLAGDEVLVAVHDIFQDNVRGEDLVFRYGGEEFMILSAGIGGEAGYRMAERIRRAVAGHVFETSEGPLQITISIGIYTVVPGPGDTIDQLVEAADQRLYHAKQNGRDQVARELRAIS